MSALGLLSPFDLLPGWVTLAWLGLLSSLPATLLAVLMARRWRNVRLTPGFQPIAATQVPESLARFALPWIGRLGFLGYQMVHTLRPEGSDAPECITWLFIHRKEHSTAALTGSLPSNKGRPLFSLRLTSFLPDGKTVVTADHPVTHRPPGHWALLQQPFPTLEAQVQCHRRRVAGPSGEWSALLPSPVELAERHAAGELEINEALLTSGDYRTCGERAIRPCVARVPLMALRDLMGWLNGLRPGSLRKKDVANVRMDSATGEEELSPEGGSMALSLEQLVDQDIRRYRKHADASPGFKHLVLRLALLAATLFAFTALFGREDPVRTVGVLLGLIAFHEFGHWVMMKLFGYRRMGRFFIPFVGPVDRGRKLHAPAWQDLCVILAGPLPGLLAGTAVLVAGFFVSGLPLWLQDLGGLALVLNAFHLLPFLPLDGGKVVDLLVFRDLPWLRPLFTAFSALATLVASLLLKSRPLRIIAIGMFGGLIWDIRMIKVVRGGRRIGWAGQVNDEHDALQKIFRGVREEENTDFLRSHDWQRQIDVLLSEVLRKRPGFATRILAGGFYWTVCTMPILLVVGMFVMTFLGSAGQVARLAKDVIPFQEAFPREQRPLSDVQAKTLLELVATSEAAIDGSAIDGSADDRREQAAALPAEVVAALDKVDWNAAGIALHCGEIREETLSAWLETLCGKMELSFRDGRYPEALRRAEILLHGAVALEPAPAFAERELIRDAELRSLETVEKLVAAGQLDEVSLARLDARISALNTAPRPDVENLLLVGAWGERQARAAFVMADEEETPAFDARFWRLAKPRMERMSDLLGSFGDSTPATVAVARHWKATGRVGEIPTEPGPDVRPAPGEAEFIAGFCDGHLRMKWRRVATLSLLRLVAYRHKKGSLPEHWKHSVPGGADLSLVQGAPPWLELRDRRHAIMRTVPPWLGSPETADLGHRCRLPY